MGKALFLNVSAPGHVIPTLGLVAELIRRGEEVIYFEMPHFEKELTSLGAKFYPYPAIGAYPGPGGTNQFYLAPVLSWCAKEWIPQLLDTVKKEKPDYIIHDSLCLWGKIIAQVLKIPAICSISTAAFTEKSFHECPRMKIIAPDMYCEARKGFHLFQQWRRELQTKYNLPKISFVETFTNPEKLNLCYLSKELQPYAEKFDSSYHFIGPCDPVRAVQAPFPFEQLDGSPLIYISFGTMHNPGLEFFKNCLKAFEGEKVQVLMLLSPGIEEAQLGTIPKNFIIRPTGTVPQLEILKKTALFIMHGAGGATRESVWSSVPVIAIPQTYEQDILSYRMEEQGAGIRIAQKDATVEALRSTAKKILAQPAFKQKSDELGKLCRAAGGAKKAVDLLLSYIRI